MIIGIDGNEANIEHRVGVGQYAFHILWALSELGQGHTFHIFLKNSPRPDMPPSSQSWIYHTFGPKLLWTHFAFPLFLHTSGLNLNCLYTPGHYTPPFSNCPIFPTIHDIGYLNFQSEFTKKDLYQLVHWTQESLARAHHIFTVSQFTKNELVKIYHLHPTQISLAYNGVGQPPQKFADNPYESPYFLSVGTLKPNKNYPFLITSFATYIANHPTPHRLIIAGKKGWLFNDIIQIVRGLRLENKVIFTDYVSENTKWSLLKNASALIIPSTYEGFGIPAIEAQKVGTPVIASHIPSLSEVLQNSALYINPHQSDTLVKAMTKVQQPALRKKLIKTGYINSSRYSWDNTAKSILDCIIKTCTSTSAKK